MRRIHGISSMSWLPNVAPVYDRRDWGPARGLWSAGACSRFQKRRQAAALQDRHSPTSAGAGSERRYSGSSALFKRARTASHERLLNAATSSPRHRRAACGEGDPCRGQTLFQCAGPSRRAKKNLTRSPQSRTHGGHKELSRNSVASVLKVFFGLRPMAAPGGEARGW